VVGRQYADIADTLQLRDVAMATIFVFLLWGVDWRYLANTSKSSVCGDGAALCQITLTTCSFSSNWVHEHVRKIKMFCLSPLKQKLSQQTQQKEPIAIYYILKLCAYVYVSISYSGFYVENINRVFRSVVA